MVGVDDILSGVQRYVVHSPEKSTAEALQGLGVESLEALLSVADGKNEIYRTVALHLKESRPRGVGWCVNLKRVGDTVKLGEKVEQVTD